MPLYTSLLFFFIALALLPLAIRNSNARSTRRERTRDVEHMAIGAKICEAAARDAFGIELDHSVESIAQLDALISTGWGDATTGTKGTNASKADEFDLAYIFASYLGNVFVRHENAEWRWDHGTAFIYFRTLNQNAFPFDFIARKLKDPDRIHLQDETANWLTPLPKDNTSVHA
jgi:hypothetical protein